MGVLGGFFTCPAFILPGSILLQYLVFIRKPAVSASGKKFPNGNYSTTSIDFFENKAHKVGVYSLY